MNTHRIPTHPGDVIKEELEYRGISQKKFSELTGVSYTMRSGHEPNHFHEPP